MESRSDGRRNRLLAVSMIRECFHLLVRMHPGGNQPDEEIKRRFSLYYGKEVEIRESQIPYLREKWASLSEYVKEIKQGFSRYYNRRHNRTEVSGMGTG